MKTTLTLAAERLLMKSWNMLGYGNRVKMIENPLHFGNALLFEHTCSAFSAVLSASDHTSTPEAVDEFLVTAFQDEAAYNLQTHEFKEFQDIALDDGVYKYHNPS
jgi:hypothetical protein